MPLNAAEQLLWREQWAGSLSEAIITEALPLVTAEEVRYGLWSMQDDTLAKDNMRAVTNMPRDLADAVYSVHLRSKTA